MTGRIDKGTFVTVNKLAINGELLHGVLCRVEETNRCLCGCDTIYEALVEPLEMPGRSLWVERERITHAVACPFGRA